MDTKNAESVANSKANSSIFDEKSGLCSCEREDRTNGSSTKRTTNLPDLSHPTGCERSEAKKDAEFASRIGIVVPIYNVAPYLRECLDSVLNQTYKNFHAVLVNDGSTDNSKEIALDYVAKDSRFTLIDKENGGLSSARNVGIKYFSQNAESRLDSTIIHSHKNTILNPKIDYIIFLDSDDFWEHNLLETCVRVAESRLDSVKKVQDSTIPKQEANSSIFDEKSGLCSHERGNRTDEFIDEASGKLPDLSQKDAEFAPNSQNLDIIWFNYQAFYDNNNRGGGVAPLLAKIIPTTILAQTMLAQKIA